MKKIILSTFSAIICISSLAQEQITWKDLVSNAILVENTSKSSPSLWFHIPDIIIDDKWSNSEQVVNILNKDIIAYNLLNDQYSTELQKKVFLETQEGRLITKKFNELYNFVKTHKFYYLKKLDIGKYASNKCEYNLKTHCFDICEYVQGKYHNDQISNSGYLNFSHICLNFTPILKKLPYEYSAWDTKCTYQNFSIPFRNEKLALEIEENINDCALLLIFKLSHSKKLKTSLFTNSFIFGKTISAYIINTKTGKIYSDTPISLPADVKAYLIEKQKKEKEEEEKRLKAKEKRLKEIERKKQERREKIDAFMANVDENAVYNIADIDSTINNDCYNSIHDTLISIIYNQPTDIKGVVTDSVIIDRNGNTLHNITIDADAVPQSLHSEIKEKIEAIRFKKLERPIEETDTTYTINAKAKYIFNFEKKTEYLILDYIFVNSFPAFNLKKGNEAFYLSDKDEIDGLLITLIPDNSLYYRNKFYVRVTETKVKDKIISVQLDKRHRRFLESLTAEDTFIETERTFADCSGDSPFLLVDEKPSFMGRDVNSFAKWINERLRYPETAKANGIQGRVTVQFTIDLRGFVSDVKVLKGVEPSLDEEAIRLVSMSPRWRPAKINGKPVKVTYTFPVIFQLR